MSRFGMTGKIVAKADREVDPYMHIDHLRQEVFEHGEKFEAIGREIQALKNTNVNRYTDSGIWRVVKGKLDEEAIDWAKWMVRAGLAGLGTAFLSLMAVVLRLAWKGLHA